MALSLTLTRQSNFPLYQQIVEQLKTEISEGRLPAGSRLPTIRQLANELGVTRLTVQNAYSELKADGWLEAQVGRGTFVSREVQPQQFKSSMDGSETLTSSGIVSDILQITQVPGMRSMAIANPDPSLFPADELWRWLKQLQPEASTLLGYSPPSGDPVLRVELAAMLQHQGIQVTPDDIVITSGAMQALSLVAQALAQPGEAIIIEQPTFMGFLNVLKAHHIKPLCVPLDEEGPILDALEEILVTHNARIYYTIPNFHNPTGTYMSPQRRRSLLALADYYKLTIVEDDIYGRLAYDLPVAPLKANDAHDAVVYLSSFSKMFMPGLRIGYIVVPPQLKEQLLSIRYGTDLCGQPFVQRALAHFLQDGGLKRHLRRTLPIYRERRDTLIQALHATMPEPVRWTHPAGGLSCWLTMPRYFEPGQLYHTALQHGLAFTPGEAFLVQPSQLEHLRLCFGNQTTTAIHSGVEMLSNLIRGHMNSTISVEQVTAIPWLPPV